MRASGAEILAAQHPHRAVATVRYVDRVGIRDVCNPLRLAEAGECTVPSHSQIHNPQAVIAEFGDKQPPPLHIDAEVIDAAMDFAERDLRLEHQRRAHGLRHRGRGSDQNRHQQERLREYDNLRRPRLRAPRVTVCLLVAISGHARRSLSKVSRAIAAGA